MLSHTLRLLAVSLAVVLAAANARAVTKLEIFLSNGTDTPSGITYVELVPGVPIAVDVFLTPDAEGVSYVYWGINPVGGTATGTPGDPATGAAHFPIHVPFGGPGCITPNGTDCDLTELGTPIYTSLGPEFAIGTRAFERYGPTEGTFRIGTAHFLFTTTGQIRLINFGGDDNTPSPPFPGNPLQLSFNRIFVVPEPGSAALLGAGLALLAARRGATGRSAH